MRWLPPSGMAGRPWTPEEVAVVEAGYGVLDQDKLLAQLPGRTWDSIKLLAKRRGFAKGPKPWSSSEDAVLREFWQLLDPEDLAARLPNRTWASIWKRASALGLQVGIPQGYASPHALALEFGLEVTTLLRVLKAYGVPIRVPYSKFRDDDDPSPRRHRMVDRFLAEGAVKLYVYDWTVPRAASALGVGEQMLRKRLRARGYQPRGGGEDGLLFAADPGFWRAIVGDGGMISVDDAAERVMRIDRKAMLKILRHANVPMSDRGEIPTDVLVDLRSILAARRERSGILF